MKRAGTFGDGLKPEIVSSFRRYFEIYGRTFRYYRDGGSSVGGDASAAAGCGVITEAREWGAPEDGMFQLFVEGKTAYFLQAEDAPTKAKVMEVLRGGLAAAFHGAARALPETTHAIAAALEDGLKAEYGSAAARLDDALRRDATSAEGWFQLGGARLCLEARGRVARSGVVVGVVSGAGRSRTSLNHKKAPPHAALRTRLVERWRVTRTKSSRPRPACAK
jgi:hypothetical protein